jgi:hypothetical protein
MASRAADFIRAYYIADAGLANAFMRLRGGNDASVPTQNYQVGSTASQSGSYNVQVSKTMVSGVAYYTLTSQGTYNGVTKTLVFKVNGATFSRYGYLSNTEVDPSWGDNWYITGMISTGPTQTNGQFNMYGDPVFMGVVAQAASTVHYWVGPPQDNPDYQQGLVVGAPMIKMPDVNLFLGSISTGAQTPQGLYLTGGCAIVFLPDGTMNVTTSPDPAKTNHPGWNNQNMPIPANNAIFVHGGTVSVQGVLKGTVTIGSDSDIFIGGNLIYNTDPRTHPSSTDLLTLVARNNVQITDQGPFNIEVDAYIMAMNQFSVANFWTFAKGNLVQLGGLTTNLPGGLTGLFDPGTGNVVFGYNQLQYFDTRLQTLAPPWFPQMTDQNNRVCYSKVSLTEL